uniref:Uncharacterized protein n=1 Tax=Anguilla anguilla TaxID=7936 RepID=A0A0E9QM44_ANGAN
MNVYYKSKNCGVQSQMKKNMPLYCISCGLFNQKYL